MNASKVLAGLQTIGAVGYDADKSLWGHLNGYGHDIPHWADDHFDGQRSEGLAAAHLSSSIDSAFQWLDEMLPGHKVSLHRDAASVRVDMTVSYQDTAYTSAEMEALPAFGPDQASLAIVATALAMTVMLEALIDTQNMPLQYVLEEARAGEGPQP